MTNGDEDSFLDPAALARAEAALGNLAADYPRWLETDLNRARACLHGSDDLQGCYAVLHDIKGQAGTFGYPLVSALAQALCRAIREGRADSAHIGRGLDVLGQALQLGPIDETSETGQALLASLD